MNKIKIKNRVNTRELLVKNKRRIIKRKRRNRKAVKSFGIGRVFKKNYYSI